MIGAASPTWYHQMLKVGVVEAVVKKVIGNIHKGLLWCNDNGHGAGGIAPM